MTGEGPHPSLLSDSSMRSLLVDYIRRLVQIIPPDVTVSSWWRSGGPGGTNQAAGGSEESQHLYALATDWVGDPRRLNQMAALADSVGLVAVVKGDHVHIQRYPAGLLRRAGFPFPPPLP